MIFGFLGFRFGRLGAGGSGAGAAPPGGQVPTYHIYGF